MIERVRGINLKRSWSNAAEAGEMIELANPPVIML
jgi:hypothetical protein